MIERAVAGDADAKEELLASLVEYSAKYESARTLLDVVLFERQCCAPLTYTLVFAPDHTKVSLNIQGAPQYRAAIKAWLASEGRNVVSPSPLGTSFSFRHIVGQLWTTWVQSRGARCRCGRGRHGMSVPAAERLQQPHETGVRGDELAVAALEQRTPLGRDGVRILEVVLE